MVKKANLRNSKQVPKLRLSYIYSDEQTQMLL